MSTVTVTSHRQLVQLMSVFAESLDKTPYLRVSASSKKDRSAQQNALWRTWIVQLEKDLAEDSAEGYECEAKLEVGVPILRAEDEDFRSFYDKALKPLAYEEKKFAMKYTPVTSHMSVSQMNRFLYSVQKKYALKGINLQSNEDE